MNRVLCVGDLHIQAKDLRDGKLHDFMRELPKVATQHQSSSVLFMGDMGHTNDVLNSFVQKFLCDNIEEYGRQTGVNFGFIIGNHDHASVMDPYTHTLSTMPRPKNVDVFDRPIYSPEFKAVMAPYMHNNEEFVSEVEALRKEWNAKVLFCHQTFAGACYDNKFMAAGGVDPALVGFDHIVAGHIHMRQKFGKVYYVGTPRWTSASDVNESKSLSVFDTDTGEVELIDSNKFFMPWRRFFERQDAPLTLETVPVRPETEVVIEGDREFVTSRSEYWAKVGVRYRSKLTDKKVSVSINSGKAINALLDDYVEKVDMRAGSSRDTVRSTIGAYL